MTKTLAKFSALLLVAFAVTAASASAKITIVNTNAPGVGFNDPTKAKKVGGNPGKTLGEQRLIAFQFAADAWGATLTSPVEIKIQASFEPLACDATSAVLGSAGTIQIFSDFPNAPQANTWYPEALANKLAGADVDPAGDDIRARFNSAIGGANCLAGTGWYLGLDAQHGTDIDLVAVLLHEFAHGLGFASYIDETKGTSIQGKLDIYSTHLRDNTMNKTWGEMSTAQRKASAVNPRNVVWNGDRVVSNVSSVLKLGTPLLRETAPSKAEFQVGPADFGPAITADGVSGPVALVNDGAGASTTDACEAIPSGSLSGKIALVDRGTCAFNVKALNVQAAGAKAMIVADNAAGAPPSGLCCADPSITITGVRVTQADGATLKSQIGSGLTVNLTLDTTRYAGADTSRRPFVYTPTPVEPGSSVSHWDTLATPNQLMEPFISDDLTHNVKVPYDLTFELLKDIGW
jgi:PA domain